MKYAHSVIISISLLLLSACSMFDAKQPDSVGFPVGKNWQIIEEPPKLDDEQGRLSFQTEQSVQPEAAKAVSPAVNRTLETPL